MSPFSVWACREVGPALCLCISESPFEALRCASLGMMAGCVLESPVLHIKQSQNYVL